MRLAARITVGQPPDLALLDVCWASICPAKTAFHWRAGCAIPHPRMGIVMLTSAAGIVVRIVGLELGADDYIPKPFELKEVLARVRARVTAQPVARRHSRQAAGPRPRNRSGLDAAHWMWMRASLWGRM
ncbi:MAG: hypothetical protein IPG23_25360 [Burkholderiales bacterium]|nr:hypothetical protein [Burkholderiales bacterium]